MRIEIAHSPDADDIFMYYAIAFGWVDSRDYEFKNVALDIETLNREAIKGTYDVTAISFALYPYIKLDYAMLRSAVSFGYGYGPKLIKREGKKLRKNFKVALSGKYTTNAMLFRLKYPEARVKYFNFLDIESAVKSGEVDAGVLIHESILDFDESLEVEAELWDIWLDLVKKDLPLPLGGMALRRSLPLSRAVEIEEILTEGVRAANFRKRELMEMLKRENLVRIEDEMLERYLNMYASDNSIELNRKQMVALEMLYKIGYDSGIYSSPLKIEEYLIPREYKELRER